MVCRFFALAIFFLCVHLLEKKVIYLYFQHPDVPRVMEGSTHPRTGRSPERGEIPHPVYLSYTYSKRKKTDGPDGRTVRRHHTARTGILSHLRKKVRKKTAAKPREGWEATARRHHTGISPRIVRMLTH